MKRARKQIRENSAAHAVFAAGVADYLREAGEKKLWRGRVIALSSYSRRRKDGSILSVQMRCRSLRLVTHVTASLSPFGIIMVVKEDKS
jgi:hypothetical protein